jgi:hypothetical protein
MAACSASSRRSNRRATEAAAARPRRANVDSQVDDSCRNPDTALRGLREPLRDTTSTARGGIFDRWCTWRQRARDAQTAARTRLARMCTRSQSVEMRPSEPRKAQHRSPAAPLAQGLLTYLEDRLAPLRATRSAALATPLSGTFGGPRHVREIFASRCV